MKQFAIYLLVTVLILALSGCKAGNQIDIIPDPRAEDLSNQGIGHFADLAEADGTVIGMVYYSEPQEISLSAAYESDAILVDARFNYPDRPPFNDAQTLMLGSFQIEDREGKPVLTVLPSSPCELRQAASRIRISSEDLTALPGGTYLMKVQSLISQSKGDQPLEIFGNWSISFTKP